MSRIVVLALAGTFAYRNLNHRGDGSAIPISGNIEVTEARMSFRIAGRLDRRLVDEGDTVKAGQPVARLDAADQRLAVKQAEANQGYARAVLAELEKIGINFAQGFFLAQPAPVTEFAASL